MTHAPITTSNLSRMDKGLIFTGNVPSNYLKPGRPSKKTSGSKLMQCLAWLLEL